MQIIWIEADVFVTELVKLIPDEKKIPRMCVTTMTVASSYYDAGNSSHIAFSINYIWLHNQVCSGDT